jgi:DNA polymerase-1
MRHVIFKEANTYSIALLSKGTSFSKHELRINYVDPLIKRGIAEEKMIAFTLDYNSEGKAPAQFIKDYLSKLLPALDSLGVKHLYVADANYFKTLTGQGKADPHFGYVLPCKIKGYEHLSVVLGLNYQQLIYNPQLQAKLDLSLYTLASGVAGNYQAIGSNIIHSAQYPETYSEIAAALQSLHQYPDLTCDIEGFSLAFNEAGIGTISFAWDKHNGIAFACDWVENISHIAPGGQTLLIGHGHYETNHAVRALLLQFFMDYKGELTFHNAPYDVKAIIYALWMTDLLDTVGLLEGLDIMTARMNDTKIIAYLATNSTAGNVLGLKSLAHEFAGNWAKDDIKDIRKIPLKELLEYNLVDALSTHYVKEKFWPVMVRDNQLDLYRSLMLPSLKLIMQIELSGMPMNDSKIVEVKHALHEEQQSHLTKIKTSGVIKMLELLLQETAWNKDYEDRKAKAKNPGKIMPKNKAAFEAMEFNPNSGPQLQRLLYELMGLPVLDLTDTKQPATGAETIEKLINHTEEPAYKELLTALIGYGKVTKILSTFIPAFERGILKEDGMRYLHGSFNLGGTVSGRLSSSDPNMQNLPAGSDFGKVIKTCFQAPEGWLFAGADFNSLEDYISALTTKDPNKLAVYERGFDGHSLRAAYYFRDQCPEIDLDDPASVNTIKKKYPHLRQDSKAPTFLLTYGGTYHGMMSNLGWTEEKSKAIEKGYHDLYQVSDAYVQERLKQASIDGYVEVAFGLRVRTPLLKQVIYGTRGMPYEASAEGRTAGNALGQSYGLLNNRAAVDFMRKVWASKYRYDIKPVALIHDAIYILIRNDVEVVEFANRELIKSMQWQELPEIQHPTVKLGAALDIFYPDWAHAITLPNKADQKTIMELCSKKDSP